jgi:Carbonic anhydrase
MAALDDIPQANATYAASFTGPQDAPPRRQLAVIACMDARLDLLPALGLEIGDAHVIRNAGGIPTEDVLRSLAISQHELGTREVAVIHHTGCGMGDFDDEAFRARLAADTGVTPGWDVPGFTDIAADVRCSAQTVRDCPWLPHRDNVRGYVFDVATGTVTEA